MTETTVKEIERALTRYGDGSGEYLKIMDIHAMGYSGEKSQKVSKLVDAYLQYKGFKTLKEALKGVGNERLRELAKDPDLILDACSHTNAYYGVKQYPDKLSDDVKAKIKEVEVLLNHFLGNFTTFCNFTSDGRLRYLCDYNYGTLNPSFIGVAYVEVEVILSEYEESKGDE